MAEQKELSACRCGFVGRSESYGAAPPLGIHQKMEVYLHLFRRAVSLYAAGEDRSVTMPHIDLPAGLQGIRSAMAFRPETAKPLNELAEALLHAPNSLPQGDRELIATYVSYLNDCYFCQTVHGAIAAACLGEDHDLVERVKADFHAAAITDKLKALLVIAAKVQRGGKHVTKLDVDLAKRAGATDVEIHDTVLIAAAFCMFNRYVDGLDTWQPKEEALYRERGRKTAREGYVQMSREYLTSPANS